MDLSPIRRVKKDNRCRKKKRHHKPHVSRPCKIRHQERKTADEKNLSNPIRELLKGIEPSNELKQGRLTIQNERRDKVHLRLSEGGLFSSGWRSQCVTKLSPDSEEYYKTKARKEGNLLALLKSDNSHESTQQHSLCLKNELIPSKKFADGHTYSDFNDSCKKVTARVGLKEESLPPESNLLSNPSKRKLCDHATGSMAGRKHSGGSQQHKETKPKHGEYFDLDCCHQKKTVSFTNFGVQSMGPSHTIVNSHRNGETLDSTDGNIKTVTTPKQGPKADRSVIEAKFREGNGFYRIDYDAN